MSLSEKKRQRTKSLELGKCIAAAPKNAAAAAVVTGDSAALPPSQFKLTAAVGKNCNTLFLHFGHWMDVAALCAP